MKRLRFKQDKAVGERPIKEARLAREKADRPVRSVKSFVSAAISGSSGNYSPASPVGHSQCHCPKAVDVTSIGPIGIATSQPIKLVQLRVCLDSRS